MNKIVCVGFILLVVLGYLCPTDAKKSSSAFAAVPRSKSSSKGFQRLFSNSFMNKVLREVKSSFSSQLEALALQVTKPNPAEIPLALLGELTNFIDLEYDNAEFVVSILAKLSRKFAEFNVFTQSKALLTLHHVAQQATVDARSAWSDAIESMRDECDQKLGMNFFSFDAVEKASGSATTVLELQFFAVNRLYSYYVFDIIELRANSAMGTILNHNFEKSPNQKETKKLTKHLLKILALIERNEELANLLSDLETSLSRQIQVAMNIDQEWLIKQLKRLYELNIFTAIASGEGAKYEKMQRRIEILLEKHDETFVPLTRSTPSIIEEKELTEETENNIRGNIGSRLDQNEIKTEPPCNTEHDIVNNNPQSHPVPELDDLQEESVNVNIQQKPQREKDQKSTDIVKQQKRESSPDASTKGSKVVDIKTTKISNNLSNKKSLQPVNENRDGIQKKEESSSNKGKTIPAALQKSIEKSVKGPATVNQGSTGSNINSINRKTLGKVNTLRTGVVGNEQKKKMDSSTVPNQPKKP